MSQSHHEGEAVPCPPGQGDASHGNVTISGSVPASPTPASQGAPGLWGLKAQSAGTQAPQAAKLWPSWPAGGRTVAWEALQVRASTVRPGVSARSASGCEGTPRPCVRPPRSGCTRTPQVCHSSNEPPNHVCPEDHVTSVPCTACHRGGCRGEGGPCPRRSARNQRAAAGSPP